MISVLIPTRKNPRGYYKAIDSLVNTTSRDLEIWAAVDADDPTIPRGNVVMFAKRRGYQNLHEYYNALAKVATGDWLLLFNDDAIVESFGWDEEIRKHDHTKPCHLAGWVTGPREHKYPSFPIISRAAYEALGCFSQSRSNDGFLKEVFERKWPEAMHRIPMYIRHEAIHTPVFTEEELPEFYATVEKFVASLP